MTSLNNRWYQVIAGFLLMFNSWGLINAFGVFQEYYSSFDPPISTPASLSWIGTLQTFILLMVGSATGRYVDRGFARRMTSGGSVLVTVALLTTSISGEFTRDHRPRYYQLFLSQGTLSGLGMSLLLVPSTAIVPTYFVSQRSLAVGLANTGASIGGIIYPIATRHLLALLGFGWAMRAIALVVVVTTGLSALLLRQRHELLLRPTKRILYDTECLREPQFAILAAGMALCFAGVYIPYFYMPTWLRQTQFPLGELESYYLLSILNAGGLVGRVIPSYLADKINSGPILMQALAAIACGALAAGWTYIRTSIAGMVTWTVSYGFFSGCVICLIPAAAASFTQDMSKFGGRLGIIFAANACASLMGSPVAGVILNNDHGGWKGLAFYCAGLNMMGGCLLFGLWQVNVHAKSRTERS